MKEKNHSVSFCTFHISPPHYISYISIYIKGMSVENKSVFGCPEVQQRPDSAKGECGDQVCQEKRTLTKDTVCIVRKDGTVKQRFVANCGWGCANGENKKTSSNLSTLPKKQPKN